MTILPELTFQEISQYFHLPISQAAKKLKVCETLLKKICRVNGIKRWPHRKIRSIDTMINLLEFRLQSEDEKLSEKEKNRMRNEILDLTQKKSFLMNSPNTTFQSIIPKNTLQSFSKTKLKNQKNFKQFLSEEAKKTNSQLNFTQNSLFSTITNEGNSMVVSNLRSKSKRNKRKVIKYDDDDDDYIDDRDYDFHRYSDNYNDDDNNNNNHQKVIEEDEESDFENLEEEEEKVLHVLYSLAKEKQKKDQINHVLNNINNDQINNNNNNNNNIGTNELYKLSLLAILNPIQDEDNNNNNKYKAEERVKELKKRNMLRRSSENWDNHQNLISDVKRRKFDFEFTSNWEISSDQNNNFFLPNQNLIRL